MDTPLPPIGRLDVLFAMRLRAVRWAYDTAQSRLLSRLHLGLACFVRHRSDACRCGAAGIPIRTLHYGATRPLLWLPFGLTGELRDFLQGFQFLFLEPCPWTEHSHTGIVALRRSVSRWTRLLHFIPSFPHEWVSPDEIMDCF